MADRPYSGAGPLRRIAVGRWLVFAATTLYSGVLAYPVVFGGVAIYADETYVLASIESFARTGGLYVETFSQYGPGFYTLTSPLGLGLDSLEASRWITLVLIVGTAVFGGLAVWLGTRRTMIAVAAQLFLVGFLLTPQVNSPMHPGHLTALLLGAVAALLLSSVPGRRAASFAGGLVMTTALIKVNVGGLALLGLLAGLGLSSNSRSAASLGFGGSLLAPLVLLGPDLGAPWARGLLVIMAIGVGVAAATIRTSRRVGSDRSWLRPFLVASGGVGVALCLPVLLRGSTILDLVQGVLIDPTRQRAAFTVPVETGLLVPWTAVAVLIVAFAILARYRSIRALPILQLSAGVLAIALLAGSPRLNLLPVIILSSLVALRSRAVSDRVLLGRRVLLMVAVLQPLHAYPVAGDQVWWGTMLLGVAAFVTIGDGLSGLAELLAASDLRSLVSPVLAAGSVVVLGLVVAVSGLLPRTEYADFGSMETIDLPGSGSVRVRPDQALVYREVTARLVEHCDSYYSIPGMNWFYVFAEMPLVTGQNATHWTSVLDERAQVDAVADLESFPDRLCLLRNDSALEFWEARSTRSSGGPLVEYLGEFTLELARVENYVLLAREQ